MKTTLRSEELVMFLLAAIAFPYSNAEWWWFPLLLLTPDISIAGYVFGNKTGAFTYNIFHHKGLAIVVFVTGLWAGILWVKITGIILFAHSSLDRIFGYGLKYTDSFKHTHLGRFRGE